MTASDDRRVRWYRRLSRTFWVLAILAVLFPLVAYVVIRRSPGVRSQLRLALPVADDPRAVAIRGVTDKLRPLHTKLGEPGPSDWLANHKETGQTFSEYLGCCPVTLEGARRTLYIQPLGELTPTQRRIVTLTSEFMAAYFNTSVKVCDDLPLSLVPPASSRPSRGFGQQYHSLHILHEVLAPRLPPDAAVYIAFTAGDLYPEDSWNFVFGQASLYQRVGVWSLARYGNPDAGPADFRLCLLRTIKTATHETGHMFSMWHCILFECNMNGSNNMAESDRTPLALCPECQAKLCWATGADPEAQFKKLAAFCQTHELKAEELVFRRSIEALRRGE
jgi:archaemetzincin